MDSCAFLLRCVFPSLFAYCWANEPAVAYAHNLVSWFSQLYNQNPDFTNGFSVHWMYQAAKGFFTNLNLTPLIDGAIRPVFFRFVEYDPGDVRKSPELLVQFAQSILTAIIQNFPKLPAVLNGFYSELLAVLPESRRNFLIYYFFYDMVLRPCLVTPLLSSVSDVVLIDADCNEFRHVYTVFQAKFGYFALPDEEIVNSVKACPEFESFNPMSIVDLILEGKAKAELPSLQSFCHLVQCAHQPLLMTTHQLVVLIRFVASLQHTALLPKSIDRSIQAVFQNALADQLEVVGDELFWFPCFSLTYLKVTATTFSSPSKTSPLYRLLSSPYLHVRESPPGIFAALDEAKACINITTHPDLRTELQWLTSTGQDEAKLAVDIEREITRKQEELAATRERSLQLSAYSKSLHQAIGGVPTGPAMALAVVLFPAFRSHFPGDVLTNEAFETAKEKAMEFCGSSFPILGKSLLESLVASGSPCWKATHRNAFCLRDSKLDAVESVLWSLISKPLVCSSYYSVAVRLSRDIRVLQEYGVIAGVTDPVKRAYATHFFADARALAFQIANFVTSAPSEVLTLLIAKDELAALKSFIRLFS
jgi:hypothetical protein